MTSTCFICVRRSWLHTSGLWNGTRQYYLHSQCITVSLNICSPGLNTLRPKNGHHFADDILKCFFLNENAWIPNNIPLKFVSQGLINNNPALVQLMAWCRPGDKPLSETNMVRLPTHVCVTRSQWAVREITKSSSTFSATKISSNIVWLLKLHDTIQTKSNFGTKFSSIYLAKWEKRLFFRLSFVTMQRTKDVTNMFDAKHRCMFVE